MVLLIFPIIYLISTSLFLYLSLLFSFFCLSWVTLCICMCFPVSYGKAWDHFLRTSTNFSDINVPLYKFHTNVDNCVLWILILCVFISIWFKICSTFSCDFVFNQLFRNVPFNFQTFSDTHAVCLLLISNLINFCQRLYSMISILLNLLKRCCFMVQNEILLFLNRTDPNVQLLCQRVCLFLSVIDIA